MMTRRILYLVQYYLTLLLLFVVEKPLFMLYNGDMKGLLAVMWHGLVLDLATAAYLTIVPFIIVVVSQFVNRPFSLRKVMMPYHILMGLLLGVIFCVDCALYPFWGYKLDASIFFYLRTPQEALASVSVGYLILGFSVLILFCAALSFLFIKTTPRKFESHPLRWYVLPLDIVVLFLVFVAMRGGLGKSTANVGKVYFSDQQYLNHSAINPAFSLFYSMGKQEDFSSQFRYYEPEELKRIVEPLFPPESDSTESLLRIERPNVLFVILEGFGHVFLDDAEVAPHLTKLTKEGVYFSQCYAGSFRTDRGTVCVISGHPGYPTTSIMKMPSKSRTLPSIASSLAQEGYSTSFLYGGDITFTNTKGYLLDHGYQSITADVDFTLQERTSNNWGCNDEITFNHLLKEIQQGKRSPWHETLLTLSSHEPFEVPYQRLSQAEPNAFAYTDSCLGDFVKQLKATSAWDSLLVVLIPDHGFYYPREGFNHAPRIHHIPMVWLGGAIREPRVIDVIMNQYDLAATLLAQLHVPHDDYPFSRNVMNSNYRPWAFYSWTGGMAFIDPAGATLYDLDGQRIIEGDDAERLACAKALLQTFYQDLGRR